MQVKCANPECTHRLRAWKLKMGLGITWLRREHRWYCSFHCFCRVRVLRFLEDTRQGVRPSVHHVKLGLLLLKNNLIDKESLSIALEEQGKTFRKLGAILLDSGKITSKQLKSALSMQWGVAPINLAENFQVKLKDTIPVQLILSYPFVCFRFDREDKIIALALYDMELMPLLQEIFSEIHPGFLIKFYYEDRDNLLTILNRNYPGLSFGDEAFSGSGDGEAPVVLSGNPLQGIVYKFVDFLNHCGAVEIDVENIDRTIRVSSRLDGVEVDIHIKKSAADGGEKGKEP
ncbi:MAG: hypothetical protein GY765_24585 [bacterium]|nr:hypothetical protein [bacterium]